MVWQDSCPPVEGRQGPWLPRRGSQGPAICVTACVAAPRRLLRAAPRAAPASFSPGISAQCAHLACLRASNIAARVFFLLGRRRSAGAPQAF
jgi:hypothetical protein